MSDGDTDSRHGRATVSIPVETSRRRSSSSASRSRAPIAFVTVAITIFFSYVALRDVNLEQAWQALRASDYVWLIPALMAFALGNVARALRWRSLFAPGRRPPFGPVIDAMMVGYFYNNILPARGGEAIRVLVLARRSATPPVEIVGTVVLERVYDVISILVVFFIAEPWLPYVSWFGEAAVAAIVLAGLIAAAAIVLAVYGDRPLRVLLRPLGKWSLLSSARLDQTVRELTYGLSGLRNARVALEAFLWTVLAWMLSALCAYFVSVSLHLHLPFASGMLVLVAIGLSMILPSPPAAIGVFEGAVLIALKAYDVPHSSALSYALVLHAVNFVPFVLVGLLLLQYNVRHPFRGKTPTGPIADAPEPATL